jgi:hypothetical protein
VDPGDLEIVDPHRQGMQRPSKGPAPATPDLPASLQGPELGEPGPFGNQRLLALERYFFEKWPHLSPSFPPGKYLGVKIV